MNEIVRVLIVDDSAYVRQAVRQMLARSPFIEVVGAARDGEEALEMVEELRPDVVTLDLNMPRSDGIDFLRKQLARRPLPVVVLSSASESGELVMQALDAGAVAVVQKPTALATDKVFGIADDLLATVKACGGGSCAVGEAGNSNASPDSDPTSGENRRARDRCFNRWPAGVEAIDPATAGRFSGANRDGFAHARGLHRVIRTQSR